MSFENAYAILIGTASEDEIIATERDALILHGILTKDTRYPTDQVELLTKKNATKEDITKAFKRLHAETHTDATVFIYFAGHGRPAHEGTCKDYHLLPYGYENGKPESVISRTELKDLISKIVCKKKMIVLNCCHAGGASASTLSDGHDSGNVNDELFRSLDAGSGSVVISACSANEKSHIRDRAEHTIFGKHLIDAIQGAGSQKNEIVELAEVFSYVSKKVQQEVGQMGASQTPNISSEQLTDWPVSVNTAKDSTTAQHYIDPIELDMPAMKIVIDEKTVEVGEAEKDLDNTLNAYLEKAGSLCKKYKTRTHSALINSIKAELGEHLFWALPQQTRDEIVRLVEEEERASINLQFGKGGENQEELPWELITVPEDVVDFKTYQLGNLFGISRQVSPFMKRRSRTDGVHLNKKFRVLLVDATDDQEFYRLFQSTYGNAKPFSRNFTVLGAGKESYYNAVAFTVKTDQPSIIHYIGKINQSGEQAHLHFPNPDGQLIPTLTKEAAAQNQYNWLFDDRRRPIPSLFILQEWKSKGSEADTGAIQDFEKATRFFAQCGLAGSCFLPYCPDIDARTYIDYIYQFGNGMGIADLNRKPSRPDLQLSLAENIRLLLSERRQSLQFNPVIYQSSDEQLAFSITQEERDLSHSMRAVGAAASGTGRNTRGVARVDRRAEATPASAPNPAERIGNRSININRGG